MSRDLQIAYAVGALFMLLGCLRRLPSQLARDNSPGALIGCALGTFIAVSAWPLFAAGLMVFYEQRRQRSLG